MGFAPPSARVDRAEFGRRYRDGATEKGLGTSWPKPNERVYGNNRRRRHTFLRADGFAFSAFRGCNRGFEGARAAIGTSGRARQRGSDTPEIRPIFVPRFLRVTG